MRRTTDAISNYLVAQTIQMLVFQSSSCTHFFMIDIVGFFFVYDTAVPYSILASTFNSFLFNIPEYSAVVARPYWIKNEVRFKYVYADITGNVFSIFYALTMRECYSKCSRYQKVR